MNRDRVTGENQEFNKYAWEIHINMIFKKTVRQHWEIRHFKQRRKGGVQDKNGLCKGS